MARQISDVQQHEVEAYKLFCDEHDIVHDGSADDQANSELLLNYFCNTWPNVISEKTLTQAFAALKPLLRFKSVARLEAEKAARENSTISQKFADWFDNQSVIVREGEDGYLNFAQLLRELRGREVTTDTIFQAMGRISYRPGRQLVYITKRKQLDDPNYKPGRFIEPSEPLWKQDRDRREREAAEKNQASKPQLSADELRWKQMADEKLGCYRCHS